MSDETLLTIFLYQDDGPGPGHGPQSCDHTNPWHKVFICYGDDGYHLLRRMIDQINDGIAEIAGRKFVRRNPRITLLSQNEQFDIKHGEWRQDTFVYGTPFDSLEYPKAETKE